MTYSHSLEISTNKSLVKKTLTIKPYYHPKKNILNRQSAISLARVEEEIHLSSAQSQLLSGNGSWKFSRIQFSKPKFFRPWEPEIEMQNCQLCETKALFIRKSDFQRHMRTKHSDGNEVNRCDVCDEKFTRKDNLTRHLKTMHHHKKFVVKPKCQFCCKRLSRKDAVKRHEKSCRSKEQTDLLEVVQFNLSSPPSD